MSRGGSATPLAIHPFIVDSHSSDPQSRPLKATPPRYPGSSSHTLSPGLVSSEAHKLTPSSAPSVMTICRISHRMPRRAPDDER